MRHRNELSGNSPNCSRSYGNLSHNLQPTPPAQNGGWHSRAGGVKNTSSGSHGQARAWGRVGWGGVGGGSEKSTGVAWLEAHVCKSQQLPDSARLFRGCDVVEPAVLSIDCYFEHPADGTAVSLGDAAFPTTLPFSGLR